MTETNAKQNARDEAERGDETLAAAELLAKGGFYNDAVSRAYYAAFHWARALLVSQGIEPRTHRGTVQMLNLHFAKDGVLPKEVARLLGQLETFRELGDYTAGSNFSATDAEEAITSARRFIAACEELLPADAKPFSVPSVPIMERSAPLHYRT